MTQETTADLSNSLDSIPLDQKIDGVVKPIADFLENIIFYAEPSTGFDIKLILVWLVSVSLFLTVYFGFINLKYFKHAIDLVRGKYDKKTDKGEINRFQALATSLSGTVGLGNIAGVAVAVSIGGPGAVLWMMIMGLFAMTTKFAEAALGVKYRIYPDPKNKDHVLGGPMYYLKAAFVARDQKLFGTFLAITFAICTLGGAFGAGNMFQSNQAYQQVVNVTGGDASFFADKGWLFGIILAVFVGAVIIGGLKSIASVASKIVPFMGLLYLAAGLIVIAMNFQNIPAGIAEIFRLALSPEAGFGAIVGALLVGAQRAAFSNEAGFGSAAIVHATARTKDHVSQGFVGMLGPFIDTVVICMVTALVIVMTGAYQNVDTNTIQGVSLTSDAFATAIPWFPYVLALTVLLFAYSTMIAWFYYGQTALTYLFKERPSVILIYKIFFCLSIIVGCSAALGNIIRLSDAMIFAMAIPNIIGLYVLAPELKKDISKYTQALKK